MQSLFSGEFAGDLALTVIGGVVTGLILEIFRARRRGPAQSIAERPPRGADGFFSGFFRLILAVAGGVLIAFLFARPLIQAGIAPRGPVTRLGLVVVGATVVWLLLFAFRRRRS